MKVKWKSKMFKGCRECATRRVKTKANGQTPVFRYAQILSRRKYKKANTGQPLERRSSCYG